MNRVSIHPDTTASLDKKAISEFIDGISTLLRWKKRKLYKRMTSLRKKKDRYWRNADMPHIWKLADYEERLIKVIHKAIWR